jgi:hypothetical protein
MLKGKTAADLKLLGRAEHFTAVPFGKIDPGGGLAGVLGLSELAFVVRLPQSLHLRCQPLQLAVALYLYY